MDLDALLFEYFGTSDLGELSPGAQLAGIERIQVDLGLETDRPKRFALWCLLHMLGAAPDLDIAFKDESDQDAAHNFMDLLAAADHS